MEEHRPKKLLDQVRACPELAEGMHLPQTLFLSHRASLRRLDQALHLFPQRASPVRMGAPEVEDCRT